MALSCLSPRLKDQAWDVLIHREDNPKKLGSNAYDLYEKYKKSKTFGEAPRMEVTVRAGDSGVSSFGDGAAVDIEGWALVAMECDVKPTG